MTLAYFSAEFGIHECLPIYAGGLGILAGDHIKSASDLGIPLVGVGLMYQKGYFRQYLNVDGWQQEVYVENDFYNMPLELVRGEDGHPLTISVEYPGREVFAQIWCCLGGTRQAVSAGHKPAEQFRDRPDDYDDGLRRRHGDEDSAGNYARHRRYEGACSLWASSRRYAILTKDIPLFLRWSGYGI